MKRPFLCSTLAVLIAGPAAAEVIVPPAGSAPDINAPLRVRVGAGRLEGPSWSHAGLLPVVTRRFRGLQRVEQPGTPTYDSSSRAWYATANGAVVRLDPGGRLPVVVADAALQGRDLDLRAARRVAVSREPDHSIVLLRWNTDRRSRRQVLLRGARYFHPRLSPDGARLLITEGRPHGAHLWLLELERRAPATDLGRADDATWHPDGQRVVFTRVEHDGYRVTGADLWELQLGSRQLRRLTSSPGRAEVEPAVSPDGAWLAFVDATSGDLYLGRYPR